MIRFLGTLFSFVTTGALSAAAVLAALVHHYGQQLPGYEELADYRPPMVSRVYDEDGRVIAEFYRERRIFIPVEEVPELVKNAFISAEDKHFWTHPGVDALGIAKAVIRFAAARLRGQPARLSGASTITQQVMKNFLVGSERSFERKIKEAILAVRITAAMPKEKILELYLNDIFLGQNTYGVAAAAQVYFGKPLEELAPEEAAYLAALPKAPSALHPVRNRARAVERRNYVLEEMAQNGYLSRAEAEAAKARPLVTIVEEGPPPALAAARPDYFTEEVRRQLAAELGEDELYEGGLTIRATVDPELQALAARALRHGLERYDRAQGVWRGPLARIPEIAEGRPADWQRLLAALDLPRDIEGWRLAVVLSVDRNGARIGIDTEGADEDGAPAAGETAELAFATERKWITAVERQGEPRRAPRSAEDLWRPGDVVHVARDPRSGRWTLRQMPEVQGAFMAMDPWSGRVLALQGGFSFEASAFNRATQARRQPGSAFKPFVYAAALDAGYTPATIVLDAPVVVRQIGQEDWRPKNSSANFLGPIPMRRALELSRNLVTVRIAQAIGIERVAQYAERFGVYENMPHLLAYALGAGETTLWNMVAAYGMIANGGMRVRPSVVDRVQDRFGETIYRHDPRICEGCDADRYDPAALPELYDTRERIMDPVTAYQLISMMQGVVLRGTAASTVGDLGFPVAGKTGTTNEARDAWFVGFSPSMVAGCYIGFDNPRSLGRRAYGGTLCGPVFREFMVEAMKSRPAGRFREPPASSVVVAKIDSASGERLPDDVEGPGIITEIFRAGTEPGLYQTVSRIMGDDDLFAGADALFSGIGAADLPFNEEAAIRAPEPTGTIDGTQGQRAEPPAPPRPSGGSIGLGTGGLY